MPRPLGLMVREVGPEIPVWDGGVGEDESKWWQDPGHEGLVGEPSFGKLRDLFKEFELEGNVIRSSCWHLGGYVGFLEGLAMIEV